MTTFFGLLSRRATLILVGLLAAGFAVRVVLAWTTYGQAYDMQSLEIIANALEPGGIGAYDTDRWPYPGGFLPLLWAANRATDDLGLRFDGVVQLPAILADLGIACLVTVALRRSGVDERRALFGAALVALGPSFILISGYHGQIDSVAALPALAAVVLWLHGGERRAVWAGLLIGLAAATKQPLAFTVLALMPSARSWRERGVLVAGVAIVPVISVLPWLLGSPDEVIRAMRQNSGVPGFGGLSALVQPDLTRYWAVLDGPAPDPSGGTLALVDIQRFLVAGAALAAAALCWWRRLRPLEAASLIWLAVFVANPNFAYQYLIWGLPFFIAAGFLARAAVLQLLVLPPALWLYWRPGLDPGGWPYLVTIQIAWLALAAVLASESVRLIRNDPDVVGLPVRRDGRAPKPRTYRPTPE